MAKVINCDCGFVVHGETDAEIIAAAQAHLADAHPDLVGTVGDDQFLAMAQEIA